MANKILLKKSNVENKKPLDLDHGEIALNYRDGNIYYKNTSDAIVEMKRLDERLNATDVSSMVYSPTTGDLTSVTYVTGNKIVLAYDVDGDLSYVDYFATNGTTKLFTQTLTYNVNKDLIGTIWSAA
jgi:hypothetical protein